MRHNRQYVTCTLYYNACSALKSTVNCKLFTHHTVCGEPVDFTDMRRSLRHLHRPTASLRSLHLLIISFLRCARRIESRSFVVSSSWGRNSKRHSQGSRKTEHLKEKPKWYEAHRQAIKHKQETYVDPETGFLVFTELAHLERGYCCGYRCRHVE
ncbi:hypothetical protein CRM22_003989 [Opisthorchis felineus]|uniref:Uncharacterized protein n=1 Tax=Opisthorchis felineus TaxID=147828 RepID=A0A4S2LYG2_OPIFE|nr:hypothetical protein CRM22_003989 [Opisthorchis felineus]